MIWKMTSIKINIMRFPFTFEIFQNDILSRILFYITKPEHKLRVELLEPVGFGETLWKLMTNKV